MKHRIHRSSRLFALSICMAACATGCWPRGGGGSADKPVLMPSGKTRLPVVPPVVPMPLDADLQRRAQAEIATAYNSSDVVTRAQALEATSRTQDPAAVSRVLKALADKNALVRFAGARCAGDLKLRDAYKALLAVAGDPDANVRVAVRYALHELGDKTLTKDLEALSIDPDPRVRSNVATVLGLMKEPTASRLLKPMMSRDIDQDVRVQASEALWRMGDEEGMKNLIAGTLSQYVDDQIISVLALAGPRDQRVSYNIIGKLANDKDGQQRVELQLVAARAMGMLGSDAGFGVAIQQATSTDPRKRVLSAFALGEIGRNDGQDALAKLLADKEGSVRLAAATSIRQLGLRAK